MSGPGAAPKVSVALPNYPDWIRALPVAEWPLFLELSEHGRFLYLPETMAVHRYHQGGVWTSLGRGRRIERLLDCYQAFARRFDPAARLWLRKGVEHHVLNSIRDLSDRGADSIVLRRLLGRHMRVVLRLGGLPRINAISWWLRLASPSLHRAARRLLRR